MYATLIHQPILVSLSLVFFRFFFVLFFGVGVAIPRCCGAFESCCNSSFGITSPKLQVSLHAHASYHPSPEGFTLRALRRYSLDDVRTRFDRHHRHNFETHNKPQISHMPPSFKEWTSNFHYLRVRGQGLRPKELPPSPVPNLLAPPHVRAGKAVKVGGPSPSPPPAGVPRGRSSTYSFQREDSLLMNVDRTNTPGAAPLSPSVFSTSSSAHTGRNKSAMPSEEETHRSFPGQDVAIENAEDYARVPMESNTAESPTQLFRNQQMSGRPLSSTMSLSAPTSPATTISRSPVATLSLPPPWARAETGQRIHSPLPWENPNFEWGGLVIKGTKPTVEADDEALLRTESLENTDSAAAGGAGVAPPPGSLPDGDAGTYGFQARGSAVLLSKGLSAEAEEVLAAEGDCEELLAVDSTPPLLQPSLESPGLKELLVLRCLDVEHDEYSGLVRVPTKHHETDLPQRTESVEVQAVASTAPTWAAAFSSLPPQPANPPLPKPAEVKHTPRVEPDAPLSVKYLQLSSQFQDAPLSPASSKQLECISVVLSLLWRDAILAMEPLIRQVCELYLQQLQQPPVSFPPPSPTSSAPYSPSPSPVSPLTFSSDSHPLLRLQQPSTFSTRMTTDSPGRGGSPPLKFSVRSAHSTGRRSTGDSAGLGVVPAAARAGSLEPIQTSSLSTSPPMLTHSPGSWKQPHMRVSPVHNRERLLKKPNPASPHVIHQPTPSSPTRFTFDEESEVSSEESNDGGDGPLNSSIELDNHSTTSVYPISGRSGSPPATVKASDFDGHGAAEGTIGGGKSDEDDSSSRYEFSINPKVVPITSRTLSPDGTSARASGPGSPRGRPAAVSGPAPAYRQPSTEHAPAVTGSSTVPQNYAVWQLPGPSRQRKANANRPGTADSQLKPLFRKYAGAHPPLSFDDQDKAGSRRPNTALPRQQTGHLAGEGIRKERLSTGGLFDAQPLTRREVTTLRKPASNLSILKEEGASSSRSSRMSSHASARRSGSSRTASWHVDAGPSLPPIGDPDVSPVGKTASDIQLSSSPRWLNMAPRPPRAAPRSRRGSRPHQVSDTASGTVTPHEPSPLQSQLPRTMASKRGASAVLDMKLQQFEEAFPVRADAAAGLGTASTATAASSASKEKDAKRKKRNRRNKKKSRDKEVTLVYSNSVTALLGKSGHQGSAARLRTRRTALIDKEGVNSPVADQYAASPKEDWPLGVHIDPPRKAQSSWPLEVSPRSQYPLPRDRKSITSLDTLAAISPLQSTNFRPTEERIHGKLSLRRSKLKAESKQTSEHFEFSSSKLPSPPLVLPGVGTSVRHYLPSYNAVAGGGARSPRAGKGLKRTEHSSPSHSRAGSIARVYLGGTRRSNMK